jgi:hypothetical protein
MQTDQQHESLAALQEIRSVMERSSRFISLSGWSGVWAGCVALVAAVAARAMIKDYENTGYPLGFPREMRDAFYLKLLVLALMTFCTAGIGAFFFTARKVKQDGQKLWNPTSKKLFASVLIPIIAGGAFCLSFLYHGNEAYIASACLAFYGLALVNGGKYTLGEIRYLGYCELALGCICLFFRRYDIYFWAAGFGVLHIIYGIIMWNRYDKHEKEEARR